MTTHYADPGRTRVRIASHITASAFLHLEDACTIGKLRLFAGRYRSGRGATELLYHFMDIPDARVVLRALADGLELFQYQEFKGSRLQGGGSRAVSRVLKIRTKEGKSYVELVRGPGILTATGAIQPDRRGSRPDMPEQSIVVVFEQHHVQRWAEEALAYLSAWDVVRMLQHRAQVSELPPYVVHDDREDEHHAA